MMSYGKQLKVMIQNQDFERAGDLSDKMEHFEKLAHEMRKEQKAFFRSNHGSDAKRNHLVKSKQLEKQVDQILDDMGYEGRPSLF